jgi:hypothetical protein
MARWFRKRWALAALVGATVTLGVASTRGADAPHKVGDVISLNFGGGEKQVKVLKIEKQADGTFHSEVKDQKTGETFTLVDRPENAPPAGAPKAAAPGAKQPAPPQAKPRTSDPLMPPVGATPDLNKAKDPEKDKEKDKRPVMGRLFGDRDKPASPAASASMKPVEPAEPAKKPGLMSRIFGPKKPNAPAASTAAMVPPAKPSAPSAPPAVVPTPGGLGKPTAGTSEPPRAMPATKPVAPPAPVLPVPSAPPAAPTFPKPAPLPLPAVPSIPAPLPSAPPVPLPGIPTLPGGTGSAMPNATVMPAAHAVPLAPTQPPLVVTPPVGVVPAGVAFDREVQPWVAALQTAVGPSERLLAAQALANCRHCGTDGVKGALFAAAKHDPNGEVRAACIAHLCKLGYYDAQFLAHIEAACTDANADVSAAAKAACAKMLKK